MNAAIFNTLRRVQAETDEAKREQLKAETNLELARHFVRAPADMEELAFDLLNLAWSDAYTGDIVNQLIEVKTIGLGEVDYVNEDLRGMRAYWQGKGGQILSDVVRYERALMPREEMVAAIDMHQDELALDFWGAFDHLTSQAQEKMRVLPVQRLIELVQAAITASTQYGSLHGALVTTYGTFAAATLTDTQVDSVLDPVSIRSGGQATIVGTLVAIRRLANVGLDFGPNIQEKIFQTGQIATYKGYPVMQIDNFQDFAGNWVVPNDEIWIIGRRAGRLTYYGDTAKVQQLRLPSFFLRWESGRDAGLFLYGAQKGRIGRITLT